MSVCVFYFCFSFQVKHGYVARMRLQVIGVVVMHQHTTQCQRTTNTNETYLDILYIFKRRMNKKRVHTMVTMAMPSYQIIEHVLHVSHCMKSLTLHIYLFLFFRFLFNYLNVKLAHVDKVDNVKGKKTRQ